MTKNETPPEPAGTPPGEVVDANTAPAPRRYGPRGPYNVKRVDKKAATFRLPPDVLELIDNAREDAANNGVRLTKDDAVTAAIRAFYGKGRRRARRTS